MDEKLNYAMGIDQIRKFLPHRFPFLLLDRVLEIKPCGDVNDDKPSSAKIGTTVRALKNVTINEPFFQGHFPEISIVPGVILIESMAQASCFALYPFLAKKLDEVAKNFQCVLVGVDTARFRRPVVPGDQIMIEAVVTKCRGKLWAFDCKMTVDGHPVAEAELLANMMLREDVPAN